MNDFIVNKEFQEEIMKKTIISMYDTGYSIEFITKRYHRYKNKKQKPVKINGSTYFPPKIYTMDYCRLYVTGVIYDYLSGKYKSSSIA